MNPIYRFEIKAENIFDPNDAGVELDKMVNRNTGETAASGFTNATGYINIAECTRLYVSTLNNGAFYDANKNYLAPIVGGGATPETIDVPAGACYMRMTVFKDDWSIYKATAIKPAFPIYKDDLAIDYARETGQQFLRGKLSGKLTFEKYDYAFIVTKPFEAAFDINIYISRDRGATWTEYWRGQFWKTDCEFNDDDQTAVVSPSIKDQYTDILAGLDKEYNLIDLTPAIDTIQYDKRPMVQVYIAGDSAIGCFLGWTYWEQECDAVSNETELLDTYHFAYLKNAYEFTLEEPPQGLPQGFVGDPYPLTLNTPMTYHSYTDYDLEVEHTYTGVRKIICRLIDTITNTTKWQGELSTTGPGYFLPPFTVVLHPVQGTGATGDITLNSRELRAYGRTVTDVANGTYEISANDLVPNNRNYTHVVSFGTANTVRFAAQFSETPTKYGLYTDGLYYEQPALYTGVPIARSIWGCASIWFNPALISSGWEADYKTTIELRDAYPLWSVIGVLLNKIAPDITHSNMPIYSQFFYGTNPLTNIDQSIYITPKSNILVSGYDQPAQKAPITLKRVLEMLRDCFRCYWFIDENKRFRIEHISWFMRGESYTEEPSVGIDLTAQKVTRNGKPWAYARSQYQFNKPETAGRYEFAWMDDATEVFDGFPIDIISKFVNQENIEEVSIQQFSSDIDFILLNPESISQDGFVLLAAEWAGRVRRLHYEQFTIDITQGIQVNAQNGWVAFAYLQKYYAYDLPAPKYSINGIVKTALGTKKLKTQTIKFPVLTEPDFFSLVKTNLGSGTIQKMSVNLSSRNANTTLEYDTE